MEVAHVLADASSGWDIHSKSGEAKENDDYTDHWVEFYDESSERYYYYHVETNATQWEKPEVGNGGSFLVGMANGTEVEYANDGGHHPSGGNNNQSERGSGAEEEGGIAGRNGDASHIGDDTSANETPDFVAREVLDQYKDAYLRWNHPYRIPERTDVREECFLCVDI